jgi:hypothetical protein
MDIRGLKMQTNCRYLPVGDRPVSPLVQTDAEGVFCPTQANSLAQDVESTTMTGWYFKLSSRVKEWHAQETSLE